jgi:hypothetical protein
MSFTVIPSGKRGEDFLAGTHLHRKLHDGKYVNYKLFFMQNEAKNIRIVKASRGE